MDINMLDVNEKITVEPFSYENCHENMVQDNLNHEDITSTENEPNVINMLDNFPPEIFGDISSRLPEVPNLLDFIVDTRKSVIESDSSFERFSMDSNECENRKLNLSQSDNEDSNKIFPNTQAKTHQYLNLDDVEKLIGSPSRCPEEKKAPEPVFKIQKLFLGIKNCCHCKQSKCLKLYCDCFAMNERCGIGCKCENCHNVPGREEEILNAFNNITARNTMSMKKSDGSDKIKAGCNCVKSFCKESYCFCLKKGLKCSNLCNCANCCNK